MGAGIGSVGLTSRAHVTIASLFLGPWYFSILPLWGGVVADVQDGNEVGGEKSGEEHEKIWCVFFIPVYFRSHFCGLGLVGSSTHRARVDGERTQHL